MKMLLYLLASAFFLTSLYAERIEPQDNASRILSLLTRTMPQVHMSHEPVSESVARRTLQNFLRSLDHDRSIFLASDVAELRAMAADLENDLEDGDVELAYEAFDRYKQRAINRVAYVETLLDKGFDLDVDESYVWRRKDAAWPETEEEWNELWRKKVKNEYLGILIGREMRKLDAEEAKEEDTSDTKGDEMDVDPSSSERVAEVEELQEPDLSPEERIRKRYAQFLEVLNGHDSEYVLQMFLSSFTGAYDVHSSYLSPRREEDFDIQMTLQLTGIGAVLTYDEGAAKIERVMKGGPAARDGRLQAGDKIIAVEQEGEEPVDILYWPLYKSVRLIRGEIGTTVILHVIPASDATGSMVEKIDIVRDVIKLEEKAARSDVYELEREDGTYKLGIISLPDFYADFSGGSNGEEPRSSAKDVRRLLEGLNEEGVQGLVLDLRNNGGGSLRDCVEMSGYFVDEGPLVQVKSGRRVRAMRDPERGVVFDEPIVVLVNRLSASASEILAAALQDYGRAVIVGDSKTHGKGTVQSLMPLDRGDDALGSLKVTTAGFFRVDGRSTQLKGVSPDIIIRTPSDVMELGEEYLDNVLPWSWVAPVRYTPAGDLREVNETLMERSEERLAANETFAVYQEKVDRLEERMKRREVNLRWEDRLARQLEDRELDKLQDKGLMIAGDDAEDLDEEEALSILPERDLVLKEGLEILADLVSYTPPVAQK
jgi:carboxyl-terminal processing protease